MQAQGGQAVPDQSGHQVIHHAMSKCADNSTNKKKRKIIIGRIKDYHASSKDGIAIKHLIQPYTILVL